ncbi:MAG: sigma 54-interacting transcriptional regulator [Bryobacteraceae bacterium]|nr:sigma 54-interacting transcriptional regulator [Bryobacteraceae bacterium]
MMTQLQPKAGSSGVCLHADVELLESALDQVPYGVIVCDNDLKVSHLNRTARQILGVGPGDLIGKPCSEAFRCSGCTSDCGFLDLSAMSGSVRFQSECGKENVALVRSSRIADESGAFRGVITTINTVVDPAPHQRPEIVAESPTMAGILRFARKVAASQAGIVLLEGENGTGKDVIAKAIHHESPRCGDPFVAINCAAMPETLLESELFGYEKGAFTDARSQKRGLFEVAGKGTLLLDEIGELPLKLQAKLLRVLEDQTFRHLGGLSNLYVQARIIAATNRNLRQAAEEGSFRKDLYYRLNIVQIVVPPLRERPEDVLPLASHFMAIYNRKFNRAMEGLAPEAIRLLLAHSWPGNVRELKNAIERAMILEESDIIQATSLPPELSEQPELASPQMHHPPSPGEGGLTFEEHERKLLSWALNRSGGNQARAARMLGVSRDLLRYRMKKFHLLPAAHPCEAEAAQPLN